VTSFGLGQWDFSPVDQPGEREVRPGDGSPTSPDGYCAPRFRAVRDRFAALLESGEESGAAVCVMVRGDTVVDLWGGWADAARTTAWRRDTIAMTYSVTKAPTALSLLWVLDRHRVGLDDPVAKAWPEYGSHGKEATTIRQVLAHQAGLPRFPRELPAASWGDWAHLTALLAAAPPAWVPGTGHAEHAFTYGHLVGEIARRIDGRTLGQIWREEFAEPLGLDFAIGLTPDQVARAAELEYASPGWPVEVGGAPGSFRELAVSSPAGGRDLDVVNSTAFRRAEVPAINGHGTAAAVAGLYAALAGHGDGLPLSERLRVALPFQINRHSHPKARPEVPAEAPKPTTGIDYLALIDAAHSAELANKVNYAAFGEPPIDLSISDRIDPR
jgi:CubicO group peptidase (beta-lactamase class C family)